jgi:hypothetical protein
MIVWGGNDNNGPLGDGGRFEPFTNSWTPLPLAQAPSARDGHTAVWTGSGMIVWGGRSRLGELNDGAVYDPVVDDWTPLVTSGAPSPRYGHAAVWTGSEMIVWGGRRDHPPEYGETYNDGARYIPSARYTDPQCCFQEKGF